MPRSPRSRFVALALALAAAGCVGRAAPPAGAPASAPQPAAAQAVVAAVRPLLQPAPESGAATLIRAAIGPTLSGAVQPATAMEFVLRRDDGRVVSVVQDNAEHLRPGDRVVLLAGDRTRILRAGA